MQLINICINAIALFAVCYFTAALAAHLHYHWSNPQALELKRFDRKLAAPVEAIAPAVELPLLLPPAADVHPFELSLEKMPALEPIAAVHQPAADVEPSIDLAAELPTESPECPTGEAIALAGLSIRELKRVASERKLPRYSSMTKPQLIAALTA